MQLKQLVRFCVLSFSLCLSIIASSASNEALYALQKSRVGDSDVFLNGMGATKKLNATYYIAALYLPEKNTIDSDIIFLEAPKRMDIRFALDRVSARGFGRELAGSLKINNVQEELDAYRRELRTLIGMFRGIYNKGDTLGFEYSPKHGITVKLNDQTLGNIDKKGFDKVLFKAWFGEKPMTEAFKSGLVGNNDDKSAIALLKAYIDIKG